MARDIEMAEAQAPILAPDEARCGWPDGCRLLATCELSINRSTWDLCDDHAARVLEAFNPRRAEEADAARQRGAGYMDRVTRKKEEAG